MGGFYAGDASWLDTAGRLLIVAFFLIIGLRNLQPHQVEDHVERLKAYGTPFLSATQTFWAGSVLELVGIALLLFNWYPVIGVLCLILFTVLATGLMLRFWEVHDDPGKRTGMQNGFFTNVAVLGGLLLLLQNVR
jgi:putative oxidoreductase